VHGYAIAQRGQQTSRDVVQVNQGSLYPALHRLEQRGWLRAQWRASDTVRKAKFYALTKAGRKLVAGEGVRLVGIGLALGFGGALAVARLFQGLLYQISPWDWPSYAAALGLLAGAALVAMLGPALRAATVDPLIALRQE
jgi:DNA-binding MarR family transcriptional regulator